jgi:hypothetical protein
MPLYSQVTYTGNGSTTSYAIPFSYIDSTHIKAFLNGTITNAFTVNVATLTFTTAPANGVTIRIERQTPVDVKLVDFSDGSVLTEADLDRATNQNFFISQEITDDQANNLSLDTDDKYNANSKIIKNVLNPVNAQDAVTKNYLENTWLTTADKASIINLNSNIASVNAVNSALANVNTVASDLNEAVSEINTVAVDIANVNSVGTNIADVNTLASISNNISTVAGNNANVTIVAGANNNITAIASQISPTNNISTVAGAVGNISTVASANTNIGLVAGQISPTNNIATVAGNIGNINTLAPISNSISTVAGISGNISTVANISNSITTVASNVNNITTIANDIQKVITTANDLNEAVSEIDTVANAIANVDLVGNNIGNVNLVGGSIANVVTVGSNIGTINNFGERYRVSASAPVSSLDLGDLYFDTTANTMKVYSSGGWINAGSSVNGTADRFKYTSQANQLIFTGVDDNSNTLSYDAGFLDVYLNGIKLVNGSDFTASNGTSIVLTTGASASDILEVIAYGTFQLANFSITDANDVPPLGTAGQVLKVNSGATGLEFSTIQASEITTVGNYFSNWNEISSNLTTTTASTKNLFLCGAITVSGNAIWTVSGNGTLTII